MTLGGVLGASVLTIAALSTTSCEEETLKNIAEQCGFACPDPGQGVAAGNASITGYAAIDGFFRAAINYEAVAAGVSAELDSELAGIQSLFGITNAELAASTTLGAAITAKLQSQYKATLVVKAQPAKCSVDAKIAASATAKCQAEANCQVTPGQASFNCMGTCTVDASVMGTCQADATLRCNVSGPEVTCMGECSGTCTVDLSVAGSCAGNCNGTCNGSASNGAACNGMCQGTCELQGSAAASCTGKCNGSCEYTPPSGGCMANAKATCDLNAQASASCTGRCEGMFTPPKATCDASASCEASARAEARFQIVCTPPSVEVNLVAQGGGMAQAQVDFLVAELKARLPRLAAAQARAKEASEAATELTAAGKVAVEGTASAVLEGDIDVITSARIANCLPSQLTEANGVVAAANSELKKRTDSATSVGAAIGMTM